MNVYIKPFHLLETNGQVFLFKLKSLRHQWVSDEEALILKEFEGICESSVTDTQMNVLKKYRLISNTKWNEEDVKRNLLESHRSRQNLNKLTLMELFVSQSCNMGCVYCYGGDGSYHERGMMKPDTAVHAIDWFYENCENPEHAHIVFFGGEPLLNFAVIRQSILYAEEKFGAGKVTYGMASNMTLMTDEYLDFFAKLPKFYLLVSIDGPKEIQNRQRPLLDGRDSYEICTERIRAAVSRGIKCTGRATVYADTDRNAVVEEMKRLGVSSWQLTAASGCAADGVQRDNASRLYEKWLENMPRQIGEFIDAVKRRDKDSADRFLADDDLRKIIIEGANGAELSHELMGCAAGRTQIAVSASGKVYPCHRFVGMDEFCFGTLENISCGYEEFARSRMECHQECETCFLRYSCRGECYYQCYTDGPRKSIYSMPEHFCDYMRMRIALKIYVFHMLDAEDKRWYFTREFVR